MSSSSGDEDKAARELPFSTGWHCAHCDLDIRPPTPGLFSFNQSARGMPACRGFGRTIAIDLNKALPDRSLSIKEGVVKPFSRRSMGESPEGSAASLRRARKSTSTSLSRSCRSPTRRFVINGEGSPDDELDERSLVRSERILPTGSRRKTYKMHVRVLLSRYRTYVICPACHGAAFSRRRSISRWSWPKRYAGSQEAVDGTGISGTADFASI